MIRYFFSYCKYLWKSKNQHGVHSPFVYAFITEGIYALPKKNFGKNNRIITGLMNHFSIKSVLKKGRPEMDFFLRSIKTKNGSFTLVHIENPEIAKSLPLNHNHILLIEKIHENLVFENAWKTILKEHESIVSLDFFNLGIIFVRKEQAKEHFTLRA